jgi:DNA replication protein DnaC
MAIKPQSMDQKQQITAYCRQFKTAGIGNSLETLIKEAESNASGFMDFTLKLLQAEAAHRHENDVKRRRKAAQLPRNSELNDYEESFENGVHKTRLNQLRELNWLDQGYNLMLMGPSGTGKTFIAAGLCADAVEKGYKAYFRTMEELISMLKMKDVTRTAMADYKRLAKANLIVVDDIMLFPVEKNQAVALFHFINQLYENTSFIITTNKMPADWAKMLEDEVLATALLDRLLFRCEIINLTGKSYRMKNRKTFFDQEK